MADAIGKHIGKERLEHALTDPYRNEAANDPNKRLMDLLVEGKINEAESLLFETVEVEAAGSDEHIDHDFLRVALDFYLKLNQFDDDELKRYNFSRVEADDGWTEITRLF